MSNKYAEDGVNVQAGNSFSETVGEMCKTTYGNCKFVEIRDLSRGNFRGPRPFRVIEGHGLWLDTAPDGVGTKVLLHDALGTYGGAARDLLAMTIGDLTRTGGLPALFVNIFKVKNLGKPGSLSYEGYINAFEELVDVGNELGIILHKGETAEVGVCVGTNNPNARAPFDWEGVALGVYHEDKMILGDRAKAGDVIIALKENGFRSNGISSVRAAFEQYYGPDFYSVPASQEDLRAATVPSVLYDRMLASANGWYEEDLQRLIDVRLIAHITGGGFEKFAELLRPAGLSAVIDGLFDLPNIMRKCADWRGFTDRDLYDTWNGGQGTIVVVPANEVGAFLRHAQSYEITAQVCGRITQSATTEVRVVSKYNGEELLYH